MRRRFDLATILVIGMGLALLPGFLTSEMTISGWTFRTDRLMLGYSVIAMSAIAVAAALEARRLFLEARHRRGNWQAAILALTFGAGLLLCCAVIWYLVLFWVKT